MKDSGLTDSQPWENQRSKGLKYWGCARQGHLQEEHLNLGMRIDTHQEPEVRSLKGKLKSKQNLRATFNVVSSLERVIAWDSMISPGIL